MLFRRARCTKGERVLSFAAVQSVPWLKCQNCGDFQSISRKIPWCDCGGLFDLDFVPSSLEDVLPVQNRISLGEPITPIVALNVENRQVDAKLEYLLPTGSFKDRGAAVLVGAMKDAGVDRFMEDSSGNAAASISAYAARASLRCEIYCPSAASPSKLRQVERTGAVIHRI